MIIRISRIRLADRLSLNLLRIAAILTIIENPKGYGFEGLGCLRVRVFEG